MYPGMCEYPWLCPSCHRDCDGGDGPVRCSHAGGRCVLHFRGGDGRGRRANVRHQLRYFPSLLALSVFRNRVSQKPLISLSRMSFCGAGSTAAS